MVEVIGQSDLPSKQVTCKNCGAVLKYFKKDLICRRFSDYRGDKDTYYYVKCPQCKEEQRCEEIY